MDLSGAHAYGFPSPDSDVDLEAIHVATTTDLLGFDVPPPTIDRVEFWRVLRSQRLRGAPLAFARRDAGVDQ